MAHEFLAFGNGTLQALHDRSFGFFRRQIILEARERTPNRRDDPYLADKLCSEKEGIQYANLVLSCKLWTYLADLNEQAQERMDTIICQLQIAEGITESLKACDPMAWVQRMNNIRARAEEIVRKELINV